jgi:PAS domain S-box-containing protein
MTQGPEAARTAPSRPAPAAAPLAVLSQDAMAALDPGGSIAWANAAWLRLLGWAPEELVGRPLADLLHPDDAGRATELAQPRDGGAEAAVRVLTRSGGERRMAFGAMAAPGENLIYVCGRDATQTVELEQELRAAEDRFRAVTESTSEGLVTADARGRITFANSAAQRLFGWQAHELLGQPLTMLMPERYRALHTAGIERFTATGESHVMGTTIEIEGLRRDGTEFPLELSVGSFTRGTRLAFTGILRDVSERQETLRQLELWGARYHALVANLPHVVVSLFDPDLRMLVVEGGLLERQGLKRERFEGRRLEEAVPEQTRAVLEPRVRAALAGEPQDFELSSVETGREYEMHVVPLAGEDGEVVGAVVVARDVTELHRANAALESRARELERSNAELAEFAYVASHDLSEPLRMISAYLQLLRRRHGDTLGGEADEFVGNAIEGAQRMRTLIEDLLAYSRAGRSERPPEPVDLGELVARIAGTVVSGAQDPRPVVEWEELPTVPGEGPQLAQLLQNLISNGVKFHAPGRVPQVRVSAARAGASWRLAVEDNGIGIEPRHAERIFGMFQRLHTRDAFPGTGIGLAIARKVVERHGGRIWAESRSEGGTRMVFTLPAGD